MADKRRLKDMFGRAQRRSRRALAGVFMAAALAGCGSTPERAPAPRDAGPVHKPVAVTTLQQNIEGRRLTADTEALFKRNAPVPVNDNLPEDARIQAYFDQLCFTTQSPQKPEQQAMRRALDTLAALPLTGRPLVEMAARENIRFCNINDLPVGTGAQYVPQLGAVMVPGRGAEPAMLLRVAHEILHAAQDQHGLLAYHYDWNIESRLARNLSIESAALSFELLVAFEMKQRGDSSVWDHMRTRYAAQSAYGDARLYTLAEETWQAAKDAGKDDAAALRDTGRALWERMFESRAWLDFYLDFELSSYLRDVTSGALDGQGRINASGLPQARIDAAGKTGGAGSFTEGARVPPLDTLLAGNTRMRQAYAAVDLERHRRSLGENHARTRALLRAAEADGNPYLGVDLAAVYAQSRSQMFGDAEGRRRFTYIHDYMDAAIGRPPARAAAPVPGAEKNPAPPAASENPETPEPVPPRDTLAKTGRAAPGKAA